MTQDQNPPADAGKTALCDSCAGVQQNWRKARGHPELMQGSVLHAPLLAQQLRPFTDTRLTAVQRFFAGVHRIRPHEQLMRVLHA